MNPICYVAYREQFQRRAQDLFAKNSVNADAVIYSEEIAAQLSERGYQVLMARGGTANDLRQRVNLPVVDIPVSFQDIIYALLQASRHGRRIGVVGYGNFLSGLDALNPILKVEITQVVAADPEDTRRKIEDLKEQNADVIVGGLLQTEIAAELGIRHVLLDLSEQALMEACEQAESIVKSILLNARKSEEINTILNTTKEGFVAVDRDGNISLANPAALKIAPAADRNVLGRPLEAVFPGLVRLTGVLTSGTECLRETLRIGTADILCDLMPLRSQDGQTVGAIATFNDINSITRSEHIIRSRLYGSGLYATYSFDSIVHSSKVMDELIQMAKRYAATDSSTLIMGETGVGKELFAQSLHNASSRRKGPFVAINCASIPESVLESELFGYEEGAFTGAKKSGKPGFFELAHKGTIFLDEIGEMPIRLQARLLRVLQEKQVIRLGGSQVIPIDIRVISATNKSLPDLIGREKFRADLFYRLNVLTMIVPPLRQRPEDVLVLAYYYLQRHSSVPRLTKDAERALMQYEWPGNVRQLNNFMEKLCVIMGTEEVDGSGITTLLERYEPLAQTGPGECEPRHPGRKLSREELADALALNDGNKQETARFLGIHRSTLWRLLKEYDL